jgi:hypothetical protein
MPGETLSVTDGGITIGRTSTGRGFLLEPH